MKILDCTIRDGSYATNYYWEAEMLRDIVSSLSRCGIEYIEIGNGTGMGAYRKLSGALTDEAYYANTIPYKETAKIGSFYIPGVGTKDDLSLFRNAGGDFVRIGANATETEKTFDSIEYAKGVGLFVTCNLMKTYALTNYQLVGRVRDLVSAGVDCVYIVDSSGGMLPGQVESYMHAIQSFYDVPLGFHGHNNLLLANANTLKAVECGAEMVDATLGGLGRGAGNAQLESLVAAMQKARMMDDGIDVLALSDLSQRMREKLSGIHLKGSSKREIVEGSSDFHSSYTKLLEESALKYNVDPEQLLMEVCKVNVVDPSKDLFELMAQSLANGDAGNEIMPRYYHKKY